MSNLLNDRLASQEREVEKEQKKRRRLERKKKKPGQSVIYSASGKVKKRVLPAWRKALSVTVIILGGLALVIYVPPMIPKSGDTVNPYVITPDQAAIKDCQTLIKNSPDEDFDGDGLTNGQEQEYGTSIFKQDTDGDGISDYAELFITKTSPLTPSSGLVDAVMKEDKKSGDSVGTPYKVDDIIFWADDYKSKAYGAYVRTAKGYRFCNFSGYVHFPVSGYAYRIADGVHSEIPYNKDADAWHVDAGDEVVLYSQQLSFINTLRLPFGGEFHLSDGGFGGVLSKILPDSDGPLTCRREAEVDIVKADEGKKTAPIRMVDLPRDNSRFGHNDNSLKGLSYIYKNIDAGKCVGLSLYSDSVGEVVCLAYGYTEDGDLLVAGGDLSPAGKIHITELAGKMMDKDGEIGQVSWYTFSGLGYSSSKGDRISIFGKPSEKASTNPSSSSHGNNGKENTDITGGNA